MLKRNGIIKEKFTSNDLDNYFRFADVINSTMSYFGFEKEIDYKIFDKGVWVIGKYLKIKKEGITDKEELIR